MTKQPSLNNGQSSRARRAFTLLEIMISIGILAIGMSAAMGLFTAAAASGRRAEQAVQAAHIADFVFADVESQLTMSFDLTALEALTAEQAEELGVELPAVPESPLDDMGGDSAGDSSEDTEEDSDGSGEEQSDGSGEEQSDGDDLGDGMDGAEDGESEPDLSPKVLYAGEELPDFPDFKVWTILTPLPGQSDVPVALFCEVYVQWSIKGRKRGQQYRTVLLRRLSKSEDIPSLSGLEDEDE